MQPGFGLIQLRNDEATLKTKLYYFYSLSKLQTSITKKSWTGKAMDFTTPFGSSAPPFWSGGPTPTGYYDFPNRSGPNQAQSVTNGPVARSQYPITTGTSVFGLRYKDGIIIAADTSGNYGNLARYPLTQRVFKVNETTVIASSGDIADFQYLHSLIKSKQNEEEIHGGGVTMKPEALHCWLTRVLYNRRSKWVFIFILCLMTIVCSQALVILQVRPVMERHPCWRYAGWQAFFGMCRSHRHCLDR